jgi:hypothetical protein
MPGSQDVTSSTKVIYVAGWGRSGSTLVGSLIGQIEGFFHAGEVRGLWRALARPGWKCGCGEAVSSCPFWMAVLQDAHLDESTTPEVMLGILRKSLRTRHLPGLWLGSQWGRQPFPPYGDALARIYRAVAARAGATVVVDTSKFPTDAYVAAAAAGVDLYVLHLVRDPRAVAHSWSREKPHASGRGFGTMYQIAPFRSSTMWTAINASILTFVRPSLKSGRYIRIRYEDLVADPARQLGTALEQFGWPQADLPFLSGSNVMLSPSHSVSGNPVRFSFGTTRAIVLDDEWRSAMTARNRLMSTVPALPLMGPMGYRLRPH